MIDYDLPELSIFAAMEVEKLIHDRKADIEMVRNFLKRVEEIKPEPQREEGVASPKITRYMNFASLPLVREVMSEIGGETQNKKTTDDVLANFDAFLKLATENLSSLTKSKLRELLKFTLAVNRYLVSERERHTRLRSPRSRVKFG
jgi:hypothetical protein